jgi:hypothetical protein
MCITETEEYIFRVHTFGPVRFAVARTNRNINFRVPRTSVKQSLGQFQ